MNQTVQKIKFILTTYKDKIMKEKDVDNILDIPNIGKWLDEVFTLSCYDLNGDKILFYTCLIDGVCCDINIYMDKHPSLVEGEKKLSDLIMLDDVRLFEMKIGIQTKGWDNEIGFWCGEWVNVFQSHWYRPFLSKDKREY